MKQSAVIALVCMTAFCGCSAPPDTNTGALFESRCSVCHNTSIPKGARKTRSQWQECVERMMAKGAKLSPEEKRALINYLAEKYRF
ncbi:MAG: hypothetical protein HXX17_09640 [Geobacteraceae bacterium]|nr:hypothetical protein [Geobacteraceae bacterium]